MKKQLTISESEKNYILKLHEAENDATSKIKPFNRIKTAIQAGKEAYRQSGKDVNTDNKQSQPDTTNSTTSPTTTGQTTTTQTTTAVVSSTPLRTVDCKNTKRPQYCNQKVLNIQVKINEKCPADKLGTTKLVEDGIWGINTSAAVDKCRKKSTSQSTGTETKSTSAETKSTSAETKSDENLQDSLSIG